MFYADSAHPSAGSTFTYNLSDRVELSKGDTIGLSVDSAVDSNYLVLGATSRTFLSIEKVQDTSVFGVFGQTEYLETINGTIW